MINKEIKKNYKLMNKAVWIEKYGILVISDLHIGYEESLGIAIPRNQFKIIVEELGEIIEKINESEVINKRFGRNNKLIVGGGSIHNKTSETLLVSDGAQKSPVKEISDIKEIIILGDLKHEHGKILEQEWREVSSLLDYLSGFGKIILIKGNHDKILEPIASKKNIEIKEYYIKNGFGFLHGDKNLALEKLGQTHCINTKNEIFDSKVKTLFMGHLHPSISIVEDVKREIYKCFLVGKYKGKEIVILPSFFPLIEGVDVIKENNNLALDLNLDNFEVFIPTEDETLDFGNVKRVGELV